MTTTYKTASAQARSLAMATGVTHTVAAGRTPRWSHGSWGERVADGGAPVAIATKAKPFVTPPTPREVQGNTADDRAEGNHTEDDYVGFSLQAEHDLDRRCDADARWFAGWYVEEHIAKVASLGSAKRIARRYTRNESPARIRRVTELVFAEEFGGEDFAEVRYSIAGSRTYYEVRYTTRVCYAVPGDIDWVEPEFEPGLLWEQVYGRTAQDAIAESAIALPSQTGSPQGELR